MTTLNVDAIVKDLTQQTTVGGSGRAAKTLYGGHEKTLRQTLIVLATGHELAEHDSPGEATLLVLQGRVRLATEDESWEGEKGDLLTIPPARHNLAAITDTVVLLTVAVALT